MKSSETKKAAGPPSRKRRISWPFALLVLALLLAFWFVSRRAGADLETPGKQPSQERATPPAPARPDQPKLITSNLPVLPAARSSLADLLNDEGGDGRADVRIVCELLGNYDAALGQLPVGDNREISAALSGHNEKGHAPLPRAHPALGPEGTLLDRWGKGYSFHALSRHAMEVRSAGPDGRLYTADDCVHSTGQGPRWLKPPDEGE